jgi:hypothetical protein
MSGHEEEYGLLFPFVNVTSRGGKFDDDAFVCGYEMGVLYRDLAVLQALEFQSISRTIHVDNRAQAELLAMNAGMVMEVGQEWNGWIDVDFVRPPDESEGEPIGDTP